MHIWDPYSPLAQHTSPQHTWQLMTAILGRDLHVQHIPIFRRLPLLLGMSASSSVDKAAVLLISFLSMPSKYVHLLAVIVRY